MFDGRGVFYFFSLTFRSALSSHFAFGVTPQPGPSGIATVPSFT
jgi:hypothetical protein